MPQGKARFVIPHDDAVRRLFWLDVADVYANGRPAGKVPLDAALIPIQKRAGILSASIPDTLTAGLRRDYVEAYCAYKYLGAGRCESASNPECKAKKFTDAFVDEASASRGAVGGLVASWMVMQMGKLTYDACVAGLVL